MGRKVDAILNNEAAEVCPHLDTKASTTSLRLMQEASDGEVHYIRLESDRWLRRRQW